MEPLTIAALIAASPFIGGPVLTRFAMRMNAAPDLVALDHVADGAPMEADAGGLPAEVAGYFRQVDEELRALGFEAVAYLSAPGAMPATMPYAAYYICRPSGVQALVTAIYGKASGRVELGTRYLEFSTRFADGGRIDTVNTPVLGIFRHPPGVSMIHAPALQEPRRLLELHHRLVAQDGRASPATMPAPGEEMEYLRHAMFESFEEQAAIGRLFLDQSAACYRPTWKGACLMTWKMLWPVTTVRRAQMKARQARMLRDLSASRRATGL